MLIKDLHTRPNNSIQFLIRKVICSGAVLPGIYIPEMNPGPQILEQIHERGIPMVIGADAHVSSRVGAEYDEAMDLLEAAGFTHFGFFLNRQRQEVSIEEARASLALA